MEFTQKHIHFVGIKGVGVAPLAIFAKEAGAIVTGSDIEDEFITDIILKEKGITWTIGFSPSDLPEKLDLVIATGAHGGMDNAQVLEAKKSGIPILMQGEALGKFMEGYFGISIIGSHGKTTTSALLSTVLSKLSLNPSFVVGSASFNPLGPAGHFSKGKYFVAEADEYANEPIHDKKPKFLYQHPQIIVLTNIDFDHPDLFNSISDISDAIQQFCDQLPENGVLIANGDDHEFQKMKSQLTCKVVTFGFGEHNDFQITKVGTIPQKTIFYITNHGVNLGQFAVSIPGEHNAFNAAAVIAVCAELGLSLEKVKNELPLYTGAKRRFELLFKNDNVLLFDDYAHHPKEIKATIASAKLWYPKDTITIIFQPHTYSRTKALLSEFVHALAMADNIILTHIYASLREEKDPQVSSQLIVDQLKKLGKNAVYVPEMNDVVQYLNVSKSPQKQIIFTMGAGDIYKIAPSIIASL